MQFKPALQLIFLLINLVRIKFIADFYIHSKYSRATSPKIDLENVAKRVVIKGIQALRAGDFTYPQWIKEIKKTTNLSRIWFI